MIFRPKKSRPRRRYGSTLRRYLRKSSSASPRQFWRMSCHVLPPNMLYGVYLVFVLVFELNCLIFPRTRFNEVRGRRSGHGRDVLWSTYTSELDSQNPSLVLVTEGKTIRAHRAGHYSRGKSKKDPVHWHKRILSTFIIDGFCPLDIKWRGMSRGALLASNHLYSCIVMVLHLPALWLRLLTLTFGITIASREMIIWEEALALNQTRLKWLQEIYPFPNIFIKTSLGRFSRSFTSILSFGTFRFVYNDSVFLAPASTNIQRLFFKKKILIAYTNSRFVRTTTSQQDRGHNDRHILQPKHSLKQQHNLNFSKRCPIQHILQHTIRWRQVSSKI